VTVVDQVQVRGNGGSGRVAPKYEKPQRQVGSAFAKPTARQTRRNSWDLWV